MEKTTDVFALGNALMDFITEIDDQKLLEMNLKKGETHFVDEDQAKRILDNLQRQKLKMDRLPGGSAGNTSRCLGLLGAHVLLCGKIGKDIHGKIYLQEMKKHGVKTKVQSISKVTGHTFTFITPDAERTFSVHLGASVELYQEDILEDDISKSKVLLLEGYQVEGKTRKTLLYAAELAKKHHTKIAFDLSDSGVIRRNETFLHEFVTEYVGILFANELEARDFTGLAEKSAVVALGKDVDIAVIKRGERGSLIHHHSQILNIDAVPTKAIDTTGAGDTYSAGFLYGYCQGWPLEKAGRLGSLLASKIVERKGVRFVKKDIDVVKKLITQE